MHRITNYSRILVGALFIVSGLIKANDPLGFSYKLEEYFAPDALNWAFFEGSELALSILICIAEIVLGIAVLTGERFVLATWSLLLMIIFFTFLTGYTAIGNWFFENYDTPRAAWWEGLLGFKSREQFRLFKDCGCFGDALKLTPWQSFLKDVVLLILIVWMFIKRKTIKANETVMQDLKVYLPALILIALFSLRVIHWAGPIWFSIIVMGIISAMKWYIKPSPNRSWFLAGGATAVTLIFTLYCYYYLPVRDYRPYAIGNNLVELAQVPEGERESPLTEITYVYKNTETGQNDKFPMSEVATPMADTVKYKYVERVDVVLEPAYEPPIHDFHIGDEELHQEIMNDPGFKIFNVMYDLDKMNKGVLPKLIAFEKAAKAKDIKVYNLTSSIYEKQQELDPELRFYTVDGTTLKTIVRSNPGVLLMKGAVVIDKWPATNYPNIDEVEAAIKNAQ